MSSLKRIAPSLLVCEITKRTLAGYADTSNNGRVRFVISQTSNDGAMRFKLLKALQSEL